MKPRSGDVDGNFSDKIHLLFIYYDEISPVTSSVNSHVLNAAYVYNVSYLRRSISEKILGINLTRKRILKRKKYRVFSWILWL